MTLLRVVGIGRIKKPDRVIRVWLGVEAYGDAG
jgi:hypothetical protein